MHRIDHATAVANMHGAGKPGFGGGNPTTGTPATRFTPDWCNDIQENVARVIEGAGGTLEKGSGDQLYEAIIAMIAASAVSGLQDLAYLDVGQGIEADGAGGARVKLNGSTLLRGAAGLSLNLALANAWAKAQSSTPVTIVDGASPAIDLSAGNVFVWALGAARTLPLPSNVAAGQSGVIWLRPNSYTLSYNTFWQFPGGAIPTVSTAVGARDLLIYEVDETATHAACALIKGIA